MRYRARLRTLIPDKGAILDKILNGLLWRPFFIEIPTTSHLARLLHITFMAKAQQGKGPRSWQQVQLATRSRHSNF